MDWEILKDTSLTKTGLEIYLGHQGKPCAKVSNEWYNTDDEGDYFIEGQWVPLVNNPWTTTVVDTSGLHSLMIRFCWCSNALSQDMQLFEMGLFPASFTSLKTAFTFAVLDDFLLDSTVIDEGVQAAETAEAAQVAWPGVNVNLAEKNVTDPAWLYLRSLVVDGNLKVNHLFLVNLTNEVALTNGLSFMVSNAQYKMHLAEAKDIADASYHKLEATGIARINGKIMETLWAPLNIISPSARGISTPHQKECLNFQMNNCNFMKMICINRQIPLPKIQGGRAEGQRQPICIQ
ncbi:hypothetical protein BDR04DRAFT_1122207 [Suillus decipiens]|nr:hypothetical protein BDR04DRAFT_1122207 [Suillus decipiens]